MVMIVAAIVMDVAPAAMMIVAIVVVAPARAIVIAIPIVRIAAVIVAGVAVVPGIATIGIISIVMVVIGMAQYRSGSDTRSEAAPPPPAVGFSALC
jgi:hypothetical protein